MRALLISLALALALVAPSGAAPPPAVAFFGPADIDGAQLSPTGRWLALIAKGPSDRLGLRIIDLQDSAATHWIQASETDDVAWFQWVSDDWLVFSVRDTKPVNHQLRGDGLMSVRRDGTVSRPLVARGWQGAPIGALPATHSFLALGAPGTLEVLLQEVHWDVRGEFTYTQLKALDVSTGKFRRLEDGVPKAYDWVVDAKGRPRAARIEEDGQVSLLWADAEGRWRSIGKGSVFDPPFEPAYVEGDDTLVVSVYNAKGELELRRFNFAEGRPASEVLVATPGFDGGVQPLRERGSGRVLALTTTLDAFTTVWLDPAMQALQDRVDARWPGRVNIVRCQPCDKPKVLLVYSYADNDPGQYLLFRPDQDRWQLLGAERDAIDPAMMGRKRFHRIRARDGMDLPMWVTQPAAAEAGKPLPAVVLVHGGPHVRGTSWQFDAEAQFLASRGYVVVEPEFRGSAGYGRAHYEAGFKQWGLKMQDDITDALRHAVAQGWVDPSRVCIMGASYGGYATLMGLIKDPEQYRCGVAFAAVSDPRFKYQFHWSDSSVLARALYFPRMVGDLQKDAATLAAGSAVDQAERIRAPLLLVHGHDDARVPIDHGERMLAALRKHRKPVEWVVYDHEGHGFRVLKNELDFYSRVEAFLARHLKP